jgi:transmembrane sensor
MSDLMFEPPVSARARQIKERAASWLEQRERDEWCERDQLALDAWLSESSAHTVAYLRLEATWGRAARLAVLRTPVPEAGDGAPRRKIRSLLTTFAAGLLIVAGAAIAGGLYLLRPVEKVYATALGGHQTVRLFDGSNIELNTETTLRAIVDARHRMVWLDRGEAFFQIAHDTKHPFIVIMGDRRVTVLGTKFLVRRDASHLEVAVMEGRVRFDPTDGGPSSESALLASGDTVVAPANAMLVSRKSSQELAEELGWRRGVLVFDSTTLAEVAIEFNRYNREQLVIAGPTAQRIKIDGTFRANDVAAFARVAQAVLGLHVENRGDQVVVSR